MKKVLLLGATSNISKYLIPLLLEQDIDLTLFARQATRRLTAYQHNEQITLVDGNWNNRDELVHAIAGQDIVYLATGHFTTANENAVAAMKQNHVKRLIVAGGLGIYDEVVGKFGAWNAQMMGDYTEIKRAAKVIDDSGLNYTFLRMAWLYNNDQHIDYQVIPKGEPFKETQVTRQAVANFINELIRNPKLYQRTSIGVAEPNTAWDKPSFY
ncbi:SDR family oxidoreductase [Lactiplantibacillus mudanjiangensis]|uniref:Saccharopine dehydrogenase [Lactobacillus plantarum] n=1 Tax=Lactiplantibacillus mudanjiangensis TaxID=1296538 RepID=A0A660E8P0_9LACO|nr:SDR family oxidoreductase [Lactiplantibacillus mudanjiangensis]VDG20425.1 saccharopine dehydrogenase [Lactobacillus plantarum] [Lactiplantibacillus mudanjiangensis]VDG25212.1 saccharopine dehydrogenase [Lactobacillus plantarum] [Lactiplantibacillus mudanjiangensis]VDG30393.1 saccharopine dehydrogenase [Lactobacillus plantarum] [Lactiplantibacillus mudanjiangensis]